MAELKNWNVAANSNNSAPPDGAPEGWMSGSVNAVVRENMAVVARWFADNNGSLTSTGSANAYVLAANRVVSAYAAGDTYVFKASFSNTGAVTVNVDAVGAKSIVHQNGAALQAGRIISGGEYAIVYDGTSFQLMDVPPVFESSEYALTSNTSNLVSHLLGAIPNVLTPVLRCKTADGTTGYAVGDEVPLSNFRYNFLIAVRASATQCGYTMHDGSDQAFSLEVAGTSGVLGRALEQITLANWRLVIRAARV